MNSITTRPLRTQETEYSLLERLPQELFTTHIFPGLSFDDMSHLLKVCSKLKSAVENWWLLQCSPSPGSLSPASRKDLLRSYVTRENTQKTLAELSYYAYLCRDGQGPNKKSDKANYMAVVGNKLCITTQDGGFKVWKINPYELDRVLPRNSGLTPSYLGEKDVGFECEDVMRLLADIPILANDRVRFAVDEIGQRLFFCSYNLFKNSSKIWYLDTANMAIFSLLVHTQLVQCLLFHNGRLFEGYDDGTIKVWDVNCKNPSILRTFSGHEGGVSCLTADGPFLFSSGKDLKIRKWCNGNCLASISVPNAITCLIVACGQLFASCPQEGQVLSWDAQELTPQEPIRCGRDLEDSAQLPLAAGDGTLFVGLEEGAVRSYSLTKGIKYLTTFWGWGFSNSAQSLVYSYGKLFGSYPNGRLAVLGFHPYTNKKKAPPITHGKEVQNWDAFFWNEVPPCSIWDAIPCSIQ